MNKKTITVILLVVVALLLVFLFTNNKDSQDQVVLQDERSKVLKIGYIIYSTSLTKDTATGELSGYSYDLLEAAAEELGYETQWVEEVGWGTALEGLNTGRYDVLGTQMWPNEAREEVAAFSVGPMRSVIYPYIKTGDEKFDGISLEEVNSSDFTISGLDGEMTVFIAEEDYPEAELLALPQLSSYSEIFLNIIQDKADITFVEPAVVFDFLENNPETIEQFGDEPVRTFDLSFAVDKENTALLDELNKGLSVVMDNGGVLSILEKYGVQEHFLLK